jgi:hypothetical protein
MLPARVLPKGRAPNFLYCWLLAGGPAQPQDTKEAAVKAEKLMLFFRDTFSPFLARKWTKTVVFLAFGGYLALATVGICRLQEGLETRNLLSDTSTLLPYFRSEGRHFRAHPFRIQVVIGQKLDYSLPAVQSQVSRSHDHDVD